MKPHRKLTLLMAVLLMVAIIVQQCSFKETPQFQAPLFDNLGEYKIVITTPSTHAARFFNQGVIMANAFNHAEAARSFREAVRLDSTCAMAYWGLAYVLGPNYNTNSSQGDRSEIRNAVEKALLYSKDGQPWEQALAKTMEVKFPKDSDKADEEGYAAAMRKVYNQFPNDEFIVTLFAESLMNIHAWDLYTKKGGAPRPWTPEIVGALEKALELNPKNPLANHLYIHAIEASANAEDALMSAKRLETLVPGAGHLVHMPSHIYINTGHYHEGSLANERAVVMDSIYIATCKVQGVYPQMYYPHNYHFLAATATLEGRGARAIEAAFKMAEIIDRNYLRQEGFETTQHYITIPYNVLVKFAQWEKILALPRPDVDLKYPAAIYHYARGMALANTGKIDQARQALDSVKAMAETEAVKNLMVWEINSGAEIVAIAFHELRAEIARKEGKFEEAEKELKAALVIEDRLNYNEPPDWFFSVRHLLGDLYMEMGAYDRAEQVYREDLEVFPRNGFALNGLFHSLQLQGRKDEAQQAAEALQLAWRNADSILKFSRINEEKRKDLAVRIDQNTPNDLIYIAGAFCAR